MDFLIAETFMESLGRLTGDEQKLAKTTAFDLQVNPENPGFSFHKLNKAKDKNFWSVRVGRDIRIIVHKTGERLVLCYVNHHDKAYDWAERRKLERHPITGAAQFVEIRETVQEVFVPIYTQVHQKNKRDGEALFHHTSQEELLSYGVPEEWLNDVQNANEDSLLEISEHLPSEAAEALLELATGGTPARRQAPSDHKAYARAEFSYRLNENDTRQAFAHPDAQRRFRVMKNLEELQRALEFPWDKWTVFLHPEQEEVAHRKFAGPARVSGSAGTGKTIVALHRAVFLARSNPDARVLLTTFSHTLANALRLKLRRLISNEPSIAERLEVHSMNAIGGRLYKSFFGEAANLVRHNLLSELLSAAAAEMPDHKFNAQFLASEWEHVIDAWQIKTWEAYRDVQRLGRKARLPEAQRKLAWSVFERVFAALKTQKQITLSRMFLRLAEALTDCKQPPFDYIVVDEAQDISISQLRFCAALGKARPDSLFFAGDQGQRIFQQPFSWLQLGVDIRGRSKNLRVNYRTSHQIRSQADRLLGPEVSDADGNIEKRAHTVSVFNGPAPEIRVATTQDEERQQIAAWLSARVQDGIQPHEIGIFVRSEAELPRAVAVTEIAGLKSKTLDDNVETTSGFISISTMHRAKGLEFRAVAVIACDDEIVPLQQRIQEVGDEGDLKEVYDTERHLLYVACTRARDHLLITAVEPASEFLDDLRT